MAPSEKTQGQLSNAEILLTALLRGDLTALPPLLDELASESLWDRERRLRSGDCFYLETDVRNLLYDLLRHPKLRRDWYSGRDREPLTTSTRLGLGIALECHYRGLFYQQQLQQQQVTLQQVLCQHGEVG